MPQVADFIVFSREIALDTNGDIDDDINFNLGNEVRVDQNVILMLSLIMEDQPGSRTFEVTINGSRQLSKSFSGSKDVTLHEAIGNLQHGNNNIEFRITGGTGNLVMRNVSLLYNRDV